MTKPALTNRLEYPPITPELIPDEVRLESGMVLCMKEPARGDRPERHKVIVLVRTRTRRRPVSLFAPDPWSATKDVTEWLYVRLSAAPEGTHPGLDKGSYSAVREKTLRHFYRYVGYLGEIRGNIDWDAL